MSEPVIKSHQYYRDPLDTEKEVLYLLEPILKTHHQYPTECIESTIVVTYVRNIRPVIQNGPMCGIVALTMAHDMLLLNKMSTTMTSDHSVASMDTQHPESILQFARQSGFTKQGEMFSVYHMKHIAKEHLSMNAKVVDMESLDQTALLELILSETCSVLIPYDADKNHAPCQAKGHKAHWCILIGFALSLKSQTAQNDKATPSIDSTLLQYCSRNPSQHQHFVLREQSKNSFVSMLTSQHVTGLNVFARHGKSRHLGLWSLDELRGSNGNLLEVDPQRTQPDEYVIPEPGGIKGGLCNQALIVSVD